MGINKILSISITSILLIINSSCNTTNKKQETLRDTIDDSDVINEITSNNCTYLVANKEKDSTLIIIKTRGKQLQELSTIQNFKISCITQDSKIWEIERINKKDSTEISQTQHKILSVEAKDIEDFKRRRNGSYTILDLPTGMIVVTTPRTEISRMLRLDNFKFYYYRSWNGKFYFDHIEKVEE